MKRHVQTAGIRYWYGDDFTELQAEPLAALDQFFKEYGPCVISGCEISGTTIAPGLVALAGADPDGQPVFRVARFAGAQNVASFPAYLTLHCEVIERLYEDKNMHPAVQHYTAVLQTAKPSGSYLEIPDAGALRFIDAIQDDTHRFVTMEEKAGWLQTPYDYIVDSDEKLAALSNNPAAFNVLIKRGTWHTDTAIFVGRSTVRITGEPGSVIVQTNSGVTCTFGNGLSAENCRFDNVTVANASGVNVPGFEHVYNLTGCKGSFSYCENLTNCSGQFKGCSHLVNPIITSINNAGGMSNCKHIIGAWQDSVGSGIVMQGCENIYGARVVTLDIGDSTQNIIGFNNCKQINGCQIYGSGIAFQNCFSVTGNRRSPGTTVISSYASSTANAQYAVADTPNGGFNGLI